MCCLSVVFFREKGIAESRAVFLETNFEERRYEQSTRLNSNVLLCMGDTEQEMRVVVRVTSLHK